MRSLTADNTTSGRERRLRAGVIWDNHACMPLRTDASFLPQLERYRRAGVTIASINVGFAERSCAEHLEVVAFMRRWIASHPDRFALISTPADIRRCKADGRLGVVFDIEGMYPVQNDPSLVRIFYELGVRWMLIAYNRNNAAGGGCLDVDGGLTACGRAIIDEMERVGMVLCLSHTGARTAAEALEYSKNPVIFSHSNPAGVTSHIRNISDESIRACARKGGVIGLSGFGPYLGGGDDLVGKLLRQLFYVIDLVGPDHVGLGLDYVFDHAELVEDLNLHPTLYPLDLQTASAFDMVPPEAMEAIIDGLAGSSKLSDEQIQGILGENWLRIADRVWR